MADVPAIDFELGFARAARADAAAEARQPVAGSDEPRHQVLQLRELDLELAFARAGPPREDIEDQLRAIEDGDVRRLLEVAQLGRAELVVDDDEIGVELGARRLQRPDLAAAQVERGVGRRPLLHHAQHDVGASGAGETVELLEAVLGGGAGDDARREPHQRRALPPASTLAAGNGLSHVLCEKGDRQLGAIAAILARGQRRSALPG